MNWLGVAFLFSLVKWSVVATNEEGLAFLRANKDKEGVVEFPSGLQFQVLKRGTGKFHPKVDSPCTCHYHGTLINGDVFDSSVERGQPIDFAPNQVIKGWTEAMQMMVEGDKWKLFIPSELAYGARGSPPKIGPDSALVFEMELIKIKGDKVPARRCNPLTLEECSEKEQTYIEKMLQKGKDSWTKEVSRLRAMQESKMKPELLDWISQRVAVLERMIEEKEDKTEL